MNFQKTVLQAILLTVLGGASLGALAQTSSASPDRAAVKADTRRAVAAGTMQPAGEAPDPIGASATPRAPSAKAMNHRRHAHKTKHRHRGTAHRSVARPAVQTPEPMTEPKK